VDSRERSRYYIHKTRPFFVGGRIYYEVTFYRAVNKVSKFDRIIAFTDIDMTDEYAAMLTLQSDLVAGGDGPQAGGGSPLPVARILPSGAEGHRGYREAADRKRRPDWLDRGDAPETGGAIVVGGEDLAVGPEGHRSHAR
jgi:hypothetical protein